MDTKICTKNPIKDVNAIVKDMQVAGESMRHISKSKISGNICIEQ